VNIGITCYPTFGGSGVVATELGRNLASRGHHVHFISYAVPIRYEDDLLNTTFHEVQLSAYPLFKYPPYDLALACKMLEVAKTHALDLLHVHYAIPHAISAILAREMALESPLRVITTLHGTDITIVGADESYSPVTRFGIERSDGVTTVSEFLREETGRIFGTAKPIRVIPNFVDTARFHPGRNDRLRERFAPRGEAVLLHMSNFRPVKRIPVIVETFAQVAREVPAVLLLVGDGPDLRPAETLARELGISGRVHFLGQQERVERIFQIADLYLLPSEFESFGLSALEAMSCGVPVIGARGGGLPELVIDGETGFLCEAGNASAMASGALELLTDGARLRAAAEAAHARAVAHYEETAIVSLYEQFYEEILAG